MSIQYKAEPAKVLVSVQKETQLEIIKKNINNKPKHLQIKKHSKLLDKRRNKSDYRILRKQQKLE